MFEFLKEMREMLNDLPTLGSDVHVSSSYWAWRSKHAATIQKAKEVSQEEWDRMAEILR